MSRMFGTTGKSDMKRLVALILALVLCFSLVACGNDDDDRKSSGKSNRTSGKNEVVTAHDGTPALNLDSVDKHITRVELTLDNWKDYVREYSYEVEVIERDAFDEIVSEETVTVYRLGYGTDRYYCLSATIEFKHKQTGEFVTVGEHLASNCVEDINVISLEPLHLDEYECTRIKGYIYFIDYSNEVMEQVLKVYERKSAERENAEIIISCDIYDGVWGVDTEAKVIESNTDDWKKYFE